MRYIKRSCFRDTQIAYIDFLADSKSNLSFSLKPKGRHGKDKMGQGWS